MRTRCFTASIEQGRSSASRLGGGAVMGDKKIKAVAVRGTKDLNLARGEEFMEHMKDMMEYINFRNANPIPDVMTILSGIGSPQEMVHTDEKWHTENFMWGNARTRRRDFWDEEDRRGMAEDATGGHQAVDQLLQLSPALRGIDLLQGHARAIWRNASGS